MLIKENELRGRPGRDGCQGALWDCFGGRIFNMAANSSPKTVPQCTLTTTSTRWRIGYYEVAQETWVKLRPSKQSHGTIQHKTDPR